MKDTTPYQIYTVKKNDTWDLLALENYNNPTYYWILLDFNRIQDPFVELKEGTQIKIPTLSSIEFEWWFVMNLLSAPSLVESPFIIAKIGDYTFGAFSSKLHKNRYGNDISVNYPNFMKSISIIKVNGTVNLYTL